MKCAVASRLWITFWMFWPSPADCSTDRLDGDAVLRLMCPLPAGRTVAAGRAIVGQPAPPRPMEESPGSMETRWRLTAAGGDPRESATESKPPKRCVPVTACHARKGANVAARMKGCGKSAPRRRQRRRQGKPHREQNRIGMAGREATWRQVGFQTSHPGWLLEGASNGHPRRMAVAGHLRVRPDRPRLTGRLV